MGVVRKQSTLTTLTSYLGGALGFINKLLLFTKFLTTEEVGLANILVNIAVFYSQLSVMGYPNISLRFFPYFQDKRKRHHGFLSFGAIWCGIGFLLTTLGLFIFKPYIVDFYQDSSPLLVEYYSSLVVLGISFVLYDWLRGYLRSLYKVFVPQLIKEVFLKILISVSVLAYVLGWLSFPEFVDLYVWVHLLMGLGMVGYTIFLKQFFLKPPKDRSRLKTHLKPMMNHGAFSLLSGASLYLVLLVDQLMLAGMENNGLGQAGIYITIGNFVSFMMFPSRALINISSPRLAEYWKAQDMVSMGRLYKRVSVLSFIMGSLFFAGIWINLETVFALIERPEYLVGLNVFLLVGAARLFDLMTGLNAMIIYTSKMIRYDLLFNIILVVNGIILNYLFIFKMGWGIEGAAYATMISYFVYNALRVWFVYFRFKIHPFSWALLWVALIAVGAYLIQVLLPRFPNLYVDLMLRSVLYSLLFMVPILTARLAPDLNEYLDLVVSHVKKRFLKK